MGNEQSSLAGLELDDKAIEVTDFWIHHSATISSGNSISVFIGEPLVSGSLWVSQTPLEKATKNLMVYRHPCILKYISSWHKGTKFFLAVENVKPLSSVLAFQSTLQICVGLHSILKALCFLHEITYTSHNNVCMASIYVTNDGNWRLGGMEYLCRFIDLTEDYLCKTRAHRYNKGIDPNENKSNKDNAERPYIIDCYAFGVLVNEVLNNKTDDDVVYLTDFLTLCKNQLQNSEIALRPKLSLLLDHQLFKHDFILIHSFLTELPLKSEESKVSFFSSLMEKLRKFNEVIVASQLGGLLLSRMVLLDKTAQQDLLPQLLCPRQGQSESASGLFSCDNFKQYLVPRLLQIFCVRDAQIRLLLLNYFTHYMNCFSVDELQLQILPELLVGIKDTSDHLVSITLRALADIVPVLGAATVIGGKRAKLFNDGRPIIHATKKTRRNIRKSHDPIPDINNSLQRNLIEQGPSIEVTRDLELPERPSPDGEEGESSAEDMDQNGEDDLDNWEDWDINDEDSTVPSMNNLSINNTENSTENNNITNSSTLNCTVLNSVNGECPNEHHINTISKSKDFSQHKKKELPDILELDIKCQTLDPSKRDDYNFFQDMEPVIDTSTTYMIPYDNENTLINTESYPKKLDLSVAEIEKHEEGWGDSDWDC